MEVVAVAKMGKPKKQVDWSAANNQMVYKDAQFSVLDNHITIKANYIYMLRQKVLKYIMFDSF